VKALLEGNLADVPSEQDHVFDFRVPTHCPGVPAEALNPRAAWADCNAYDVKVRELAKAFNDNFRQFAGEVSPGVRDAGPLV
jgi:phosphoenolpyruvate carboxykinase (ATP)